MCTVLDMYDGSCRGFATLCVLGETQKKEGAS